MANHSSTLAWEIPWTEEPGGPQSVGLQRVRHNRATEHACRLTLSPLFAACLCLAAQRFLGVPRASLLMVRPLVLDTVMTHSVLRIKFSNLTRNCPLKLM